MGWSSIPYISFQNSLKKLYYVALLKYKCVLTILKIIAIFRQMIIIFPSPNVFLIINIQNRQRQSLTVLSRVGLEVENPYCII